jgi:hypothetical protein
VGHELHPALVDCALRRLTSHIPMRTWMAAMGGLSQAAAVDGAPERANGTEGHTNEAGDAGDSRG